MEILLVVFAFLMLLIGLAGCVLPVLPGAPLSYLGLLLLHFTERVDFSDTQLLGWGLIVVVLQVLDYVTPMIGSKCSGGTIYGNRGCVAGTILGLFFMPWGIIVGPFLGAVGGELLGGRDLQHAVYSGIGALVGFMLGTLLKVVVCLYFLSKGIAALI